jgi:hypothetical protein
MNDGGLAARLLIALACVAIAVTSVARAQAVDLSHVPQIKETAARRDARMQWWRDAKFGMFLHWGPVSLSGKERRPPSYMWPFSLRDGPLLAPLASTPPLSLVKTTSVLTAKPVRSSASNTFPMPSSRCSIDATSLARFSKMAGSRCFTFSNYSGGGWIGSCGAL